MILNMLKSLFFWHPEIYFLVHTLKVNFHVDLRVYNLIMAVNRPFLSQDFNCNFL